MTYSARIAAGISLAALLGISSAFGQVAVKPTQAPTDQKEQKKPEAQRTSAPEGVTIFVDPVTHQIRQADAAEIGALTRGSEIVKGSQTATPETFRGPGNSFGIKLDDSTHSFMVVTKRPDGKLDMDCVTGAKAAADRVTAPAPVSGTPATVGPKAVTVATKKEKNDVQ